MWDAILIFMVIAHLSGNRNGAVFIDCIFQSKIKTMGTEAEQCILQGGWTGRFD